MFRKIAGLTSFLIWLVMMGTLYVREIRPAMISAQRPTYRDYFSENVGKVSRMGIYINQERIGFSQTELIQTPGGTSQMVNETELRSSVFGRMTNIKSLMTVNLDSELKLDDFSLAVYSDIIRVNMSGIFREGKLLLTLEAGGSRMKRAIDFDPDELIVNSLAPFTSAQDLKVGKKWSVRMLNPVGMTMDNIDMEVEAKEKFIYDGRETDVFRVAMALPGTEEKIYSLIDEEGRVMRQNTPYGFYLVREAVKENEND